MKNKIVFCYHDKCFDGFGAAYIADRWFGTKNFEFKLLPYAYKSDASIAQFPIEYFAKDTLVIFADYCPPIGVLKVLETRECTVLVIDHHLTAQQDLQSVQDFTGKSIEALIDLWNQLKGGAVLKIFDMNRSGAGLVWDFFYPNALRPLFLDYIEDRDLWKFKLPNSKLVNTYIQSQPMTFDSFHLMEKEIQVKVNEIALRGKTVFDYQNNLIARALDLGFKTVQAELDLDEEDRGGKVLKIALLNIRILQSEAGNEILSRHQEIDIVCMIDMNFANDTMRFSFRSRAGSDTDCTFLARDLGGGGHKNAAGAVVTLAEGIDWLLSVGWYGGN